MEEPIVKIEQLTYRYPQAEGEDVQPLALDGVNLQVYPGEFVAVVGHNGSGKSTLARQINALLLPEAGVVWVKGMRTDEEENLWEIRRTAGMVFQNPDNQLVANVVEDDVAFGPENIGVPRAQLRVRVDEALAAVKMSQFADKAPHMLSGGQKQRVAIAGVLALRPDIVVMDEPTAMLDPEGRREVMQVILDLKAQGITVLLITHFMEEAARADRVVVIDNAKMITQGTPREVFRQRDMLMACGLTIPAINELGAQLRQAGIPVSEDADTVERMADELCPLFLKK
ncbi:MAG: energy-coupling factor transporter ATPase [Eubacteriales bacterium]|nr:energy-coupling factor transporter ATPase [Eubacteriales bacterium]